MQTTYSAKLEELIANSPMQMLEFIQQKHSEEMSKMKGSTEMTHLEKPELDQGAEMIHCST